MRKRTIRNKRIKKGISVKNKRKFRKTIVSFQKLIICRYSNGKIPILKS